jgi:O-antigen/teichoic acid export membrane protein
MSATASARAARGAGLLVIQGLSANVFSIIYFAFVARLLPSVADYGALTAVGLLVNLFYVGLSIFQPVAGTKFISSFLATGQKGEAKGVFARVAGFATLSGGLAAAFTYATAPFLVASLLGQGQAQFVHTLQLASVDVLLLSVSQALIGLCTGIQEYKVVSFSGIASSAVRSFGSIAALLLGGGVNGVVLTWILGDMTNVALLSGSSIAFFRGVATRPTPLTPLFRYSLPLYLSALVGYLQGNLDRYILVGIAGVVSLGVYSPAVAASGVITGMLGSISNALLPHVSGVYEAKGGGPMVSTLRGASRFVLLAYVPIAVGVATLAYPIISLFVGSRYIAGAPVLALLAASSVLQALVLPSTIVVYVVGRTRINLEASVMAVVTSMALSLLLVAPLGSLGAALARVGLLLVNSAFFAYAVSRLVPLPYESRAMRNSLAGSAVMALVLFALQAVDGGRYLLPIYILIGFLVYALMLRLLRAVDPEDLEMVKHVLPDSFGPLVTCAGRLVGVGLRAEVVEGH